MRLSIRLIILFFSFSQSVAFSQNKKIDNIRGLRVLLMNNIRYSDSVHKAKYFETVIVAVTLDSGEVKETHIWCRNDSKVKADIERVLPLITTQWRTKSKHLKMVYVPLIIAFPLESDEAVNEKGIEFANLLKLFSQKLSQKVFIDKVLVIQDITGIKRD
jgi:hypothetical protein